MTALAHAFDPGGCFWDDGRRRINYTVSGDGDQGVVLLIAGLGMQRIEWTDTFVAALQAAGYRTLLPDNRDCGATAIAGPYTLEEMARDLIALVEALQIDRVHVVGISMGGMIAQHFALAAPERTASLTSLMSTTGRRGVGRPHEITKWIFTTPAATSSLDDYVAYALRQHRSMAGPRYLEETRAREVAVRAYGRGIRPDGTIRQLAAIQADGDRTERLSALAAPTLVVHGDDDPMIDLSGGQDTAAAIPGARLVTFAGLGHTLPRELAAELAALLVEHFRAADAAASA